MIPRIIHILCRDRAAPGSHTAGVRALHPGWDIMLYDDEAMQQLVRKFFNDSSKRYFAFPKEIQRRDIFRMLITAQEGGFYLDTDMHCKKPLDNLLSHKLVLAEEKTLSPAEMQLPHHRYPLRIANYMFGCVPGHPFISAFAAATLNNSRVPVLCENDVLETTGPGMLTNFYHEYKHLYEDITLLRNHNLFCAKRCCRQPSCHFGSYAAHLHEGSWRWQ